MDMSLSSVVVIGVCCVFFFVKVFSVAVVVAVGGGGGSHGDGVMVTFNIYLLVLTMLWSLPVFTPLRGYWTCRLALYCFYLF